VAAEDEQGRRALSIYSRPERTDAAEGGWTLHAAGGLVADAGEPDLRGLPDRLWPPGGAEAVDVEVVYGRLGDAGFEYGPVFQGLERAWRLGDEVLAEVGLPETEVADANSFGLHPALLDAALHPVALDEGDGESRLPFSFAGARLLGDGASSLRVR